MIGSMGGLGSIGRLLVAAGAALALLGVALLVADRFPGLRIGRLPGDIRIERDGFRLYFPLATSIVVSLFLTLALWIVSRFR